MLRLWGWWRRRRSWRVWRRGDGRRERRDGAGTTKSEKSEKGGKQGKTFACCAASDKWPPYAMEGSEEWPLGREQKGLQGRGWKAEGRNEGVGRVWTRSFSRRCFKKPVPNEA